MEKHTAIINGEVEELRFEFEALCEMQERYGVNVFEDTSWRASAHVVSILLWGALQHKGTAAPTREDIRKGLKMADYRAATKAVYAALGDALPKKEAKPDAKRNAA